MSAWRDISGKSRSSDHRLGGAPAGAWIAAFGLFFLPLLAFLAPESWAGEKAKFILDGFAIGLGYAGDALAALIG